MNDFTLQDALIIVGALGIVIFLTVIWPLLQEGLHTRTPARASLPRRPEVKPPAGTSSIKNETSTHPLLPMQDWLPLVNNRPDQVPHLGIEGATGTTKTTLAEAIIASRCDLVTIITAKPDEHEWGGLPFVTIDDDGKFRAAEALMREILAEVSRRLVAAKHQQPVGGWITIVLDDFTRLRQKCPSAGELIELVGDQGRSIHVRLILITRSRLVEALGIKGQGDWRDNLVFITLDRSRRATLEWDGEHYRLDTHGVLTLSKRPLSPSRGWRPPPAPSPAWEQKPPAVLPQRNRASVSGLLDEDLSEQAIPVSAPPPPNPALVAHTGMGGIAGISQSYANTASSGHTEREEEAEGSIPATLTPEAIRILYNAWGSKNKVARLLSGGKQKRLAIIDQALTETEEAPSVHHEIA